MPPEKSARFKKPAIPKLAHPLPGLLLLILPAGCSTPPASFQTPPFEHLRLVHTPDGQYAIEGVSPLSASAGPTVLRIDLENRSLPCADVLVTGRAERPPSRERVIIDTGQEEALRLTIAAARRVRPRIWSESEGRVRVWGLERKTATLAVSDSLQLGNAKLIGIPTLVPGPHADPRTGERLSCIGMKALAHWDRVMFDWHAGTMTLIPPGEQTAPAYSDPSIPEMCIEVPFDWWRPKPERANELAASPRPYGPILIPATIGSSPINLMLDTGFEGDLAVPSSLVTSPAWASAFEITGSVTLTSTHAAKPAPIGTMRQPVTLADRRLEGLSVIIYDDSARPDGFNSMMPIAGAALLRRFNSIEINIPAKIVRFWN